jgi:acetyl esterase/lipase
MERTTFAYGETEEQVVDLQWPDEGAGPFPVVVLVHGGFWRQQYGRDLMAGLADDAVGRGWATANVEYRRVGGAGGWPATFVDVADAVDALARVDAPLDLDRVAVVGHSAGGHMAAWVASRRAIPTGEVGADPVVTPCAAVSQAGVVALAEAGRAGIGEGAVTDLMGGGPEAVPDRYAVGDPLALAPPPVPLLLVHARGDDRVPFDQSQVYADAVGAPAELHPVPGDHFTVIDPHDPSWDDTMDWLAARCG